MKKSHNNYDLYYKINSFFTTKPILDASFLDWFIGFVEGDGSFNCLKREDRTTAEYSLSIKQKDHRVLEYIRDQFGFGTIYSDTGYYKLVFQRREYLLQIIAICSGNMKLTPRLQLFETWAVGVLDDIKKSSRLRPKEVPWCSLLDQFSESPFSGKRNFIDLETAWLSGFMQAEGSFLAEFFSPQKRSHPLGYQILVRVSFRQNDALVPFGELYARLGGHISKQGDKITLSSLTAVRQFQDYFTRFPMRGRKKIAQDRWFRVIRLREKPPKIALPPQGTLEYDKFVRVIRSVNKCQYY